MKSKYKQDQLHSVIRVLIWIIKKYQRNHHPQKKCRCNLCSQAAKVVNTYSHSFPDPYKPTTTKKPMAGEIYTQAQLEYLQAVDEYQDANRRKALDPLEYLAVARQVGHNLTSDKSPEHPNVGE